MLRFRLEQSKEDIDADAVKTDTQDAMEMLHDLQSQLEAVSIISLQNKPGLKPARSKSPI